MQPTRVRRMHQYDTRTRYPGKADKNVNYAGCFANVIRLACKSPQEISSPYHFPHSLASDIGDSVFCVFLCCTLFVETSSEIYCLEKKMLRSLVSTWFLCHRKRRNESSCEKASHASSQNLFPPSAHFVTQDERRTSRNRLLISSFCFI
jgi:hypothetical protein